MIPVEVSKHSIRRTNFNPNDNSDAIRIDLDLVEKAREQACIRQEACQQQAARRHNSKSRGRQEKLGRKGRKESSRPIERVHSGSEKRSSIVPTD
ncbi:hypothetical protein CR513_38837, partial [Mucuna pruriens]